MTNPLHDEIRAHVLHMIRAGDLSEGDTISDQRIAVALDVSRTPVRTVLARLAEEGGIEKARRGWRVTGAPEDGDTDTDGLIARMLRDHVSGALGAELLESDLMQRFGVRRATVKRIMERLSADGLVERRRGHGWRVVKGLAAPDAVRDSYVFRELLECGALARDDWRDDAQERGELVARHRDLLSATPGTLGPARWFDTNSRFHDYIARGSGNAFVIRALAQQTRLRRLLEYAAFADLTDAQVRTSCEEHLAILDRIGRGETGIAAELLRDHLRRASR